ncbi:MAG TPA: hypothetical protein VLZ75_08975 [Chitinophagales bacterium]|nr:hypothetical protein [Chitinophagales bacterium]
MNTEEKGKSKIQILEWLIEDYVMMNPKDLFEKEKSKEIEITFEMWEITELEKIEYLGRKLIRRDSHTIYFYPLHIKGFLADPKSKIENKNKITS